MENRDFKRILKDKLLRSFKIEEGENLAGERFDILGRYDEKIGRYFAFKELTFDSFGSNEVIMCREHREGISGETIENIKRYLRENYREIAPVREDHMCTVLTFILIGRIEEGDVKRIKGFDFYRSYLLGLKGWINTKIICVDPEEERVVCNRLGERELKFIGSILNH